MSGGTAVVVAALAAGSVALLVPARAHLPSPGRSPGPGRRAAPAPATWAGAAAGVGVLLVLPGAVGMVVAVVVGIGVHHKVSTAETRTSRRRREALEHELPHVVDLLASLLVAGAAPEEALARVRRVVRPAMADELAPWVDRLRLGADPLAVWADLASHPRLGRLGATLRRATASGAPVAEALSRLGGDLRAAARAAALERVRQVEVRATAPLAACLLPAFVLLGVVPLVAGTVGRLGLS